MKTFWTWAAMVVFAVAASGQSSTGAGEGAGAAAQAGRASASAAQAASVSAELTKRIDSKNAKVGDEVFAKTTREARLADGTKIPKGSKLLGRVTDARAKSKDNRNGWVTFCFDRAVLKDGHEVPVNAMVRSIAAPAVMAPSSDDMMPGGISGANGGMPPAGGPGLAGNGPGGAVRGATGMAGGVPSAAGSGLSRANSGIDGSLDGAANEAGALGGGARAGLDGTALNNAAAAGGGVSGGARPVGNLSGVTFAAVHVAASAENGGASASGVATMGTMVTGHHQNVSLDSGSQMTMSVVPR
ncbi:MAG: hypothetical protein ACLGXA_13615 [Acidobacteriota bacterium]